MPEDLLRKRDAAMPARTPPDRCRGHGFERKAASVAPNEHKPPVTAADNAAAMLKPTLDAIDAGERLAEVVKRLKALEIDMVTERHRVEPSVFWVGVHDRLGRTIRYAEHGK